MLSCCCLLATCKEILRNITHACHAIFRYIHLGIAHAGRTSATEIASMSPALVRRLTLTSALSHKNCD